MAQAPRQAGHGRGDWWILLHLIGYVFPIILLLGGYMIPAMHTSVFSFPSTSVRAELYFWLFWEAIATFAWLVIDFIVITSQKSSATHLVVNVFVSSTINNILVFLTGGVIFLGTMEWWLVVPVVGAMVDDYVVGNRAIVNALQKPFGLPGAAGH